MGFVLVIAFIAIICIFLLAAANRKVQQSTRAGVGPAGAGRSRRIDYSLSTPPADLGIRADVPLGVAAKRLERAFDAGFRERLRVRVLGKHSGMSEAEYEWKLLELKRYLLMNAVLRHVPMFSEAVDDIWHEMLMFTQEYQRLCEDFAGTFIHHAPHAAPQPMPNERAWFDWVYSQLFAATPYSGAVWGAFCRYPLAKERLDRLRSAGKEELLAELFNREAAMRHAEVAETIELLIARAKRQIDDAPSFDPERERSSYASDPLMYMSGAMIGYSLLDDGLYQERMNELQPEEERNRDNSACTSGTACASGDCSGGGGDGGDNSSSCGGSGDSGGGSSGCSSGSSCGGSSSCGGGGGD